MKYTDDDGEWISVPLRIYVVPALIVVALYILLATGIIGWWLS